VSKHSTLDNTCSAGDEIPPITYILRPERIQTTLIVPRGKSE